MPLYDFNLLDLNSRAEYVWAVGDYVGSDYKGPSNFYTLGAFYVEVAMNPGTTKILRAVPFITGARYARMVECMAVPI
jgi:hypothetical protein